MKKIVFIAICTLGFLSIISCRSTSASCGLAKNNTKQTQQNFQQTTVVVANAAAK